jgi:hypothetical protein
MKLINFFLVKKLRNQKLNFPKVGTGTGTGTRTVINSNGSATLLGRNVFEFCNRGTVRLKVHLSYFWIKKEQKMSTFFIQYQVLYISVADPSSK